MRRNFESANGLVSLLNSKTPTRLQLAWRRSQHHGQHHPFLAVRRTAPWLVTKQSSCRLQWIQRFPVLSASKWAAKQKENAWWCSATNQFKWNFSNWLKACIFQRSPNANMSYKYSPSQERLQGCGIGRRLDRGETCPLYRQYVSSLLGLSLPNVRESCQNVSQTTVNVALSPAVVRWMNNSWEDGVYIALKRHKTDTSNERSIRIQKTFCASNCWQGKCCQRDRITAYQIALYTARKDGNPCSFRHHSNS